MPYGTIFYEDLAKLAKYFHLFDKVYIGTLWSDGFNPEDPASNTRAAEQQGQVIVRFPSEPAPLCCDHGAHTAFVRLWFRSGGPGFL